MNRTGMSVTCSHREKPSIEEQIVLYAKTGFDSVFLSCGVCDDFSKIPKWSQLARENAIILEAVHAPSDKLNSLWEGNGEECLSELFEIIDYMKKGAVDKMVLHVIGGSLPERNDCGKANFSRLEKYAKERHIHICYENSISYEHLKLVLDNSDSYHGFCWDSGHNNCYLSGVPLLKIFKDRLLYTHLHDNFGDKDHHLLPFDGNIAWDKEIEDLKGYTGTLNLELSCMWKSEYNDMSYIEFTQKALERVTKIRKMTS
ncbi:MAG: sugar phosphate isomerase/epimerase [Clostridia bacterium]|nr:sugar phosphate isomerase/epimerase [Clostridia bacterium]